MVNYLNYDPFESAPEAQGSPNYLNYDPFAAEGEAPPEPESLVSVGAKGVARGTLGIGESIGTAIEWLGNRLGSKATAEVGKETGQYWKETAEQFPKPKGIEGNIWDNPELLGNASWWVSNVAEMAPMLAATILPGGIAQGILKSAGAGIKLARLGGMVSGGLAGGAIEGAQTYKSVLEAGGTEEEAARAGELMTVGAGALNALSVGKILAKAGSGFKARILKHLGAGAWEGITEGLEEPTEVFSKYIAKYLAD